MNLADCYRVLGLSDGASTAQVKGSYRRLARRYHPDVNAGDQVAQAKFIELTEAYKFILSALNLADRDRNSYSSPTATPGNTPVDPDPPANNTVNTKPRSAEFMPPLSPLEEQMKWTSYQHLQELLKEQRFARAIALVEGLAQRLPRDPEVRQWQAIAYQCWGRHLVKERQLEKARIYLKKALKTDPHNRTLWAEVETDFRRLEQMV